MNAATLKRGSPCVFLYGGKWHPEAKVLTVYNEFHGTLRVEDRKGLDYVLQPTEVRSVSEHEEALAEERRKRDLQEYGDLMKAWAEGKRTKKELAEATNTPLQGIASRIRAAKRRNLLPSE
jgi:hypothetical protein